MDSGSSEIFFLERSLDEKYIKADIFDRPTAFAVGELESASDPMEALSASLNKFGDVNLPYICSLLPEKEESEILSEWKVVSITNPKRTVIKLPINLSREM